MAFLGKLLSAILKVGAVVDGEPVLDMKVLSLIEGHHVRDFPAVPVEKEPKAATTKSFILILVVSLFLLNFTGFMIARRKYRRQLNNGTIEEGEERDEEQLMLIGNAAEANRGNDPVEIESNSHRRCCLYTFEAKCNLRTRFALVNFVLEIPSAVLEQIGSDKNPDYFLIVMLVYIASVLFCLVELVHKARKSNVTWRWSGERIPWFYYPPPAMNRPFGTCLEMIGLSCAVAQCIVTTINYYFFIQDHTAPIKVSVWPMIFAFGVLYSKFMANPNARMEGKPGRIKMRAMLPLV